MQHRKSWRRSKGRALGQNVLLVFQYIPVWVQYHTEHTETMIQSVFMSYGVR